MTPFIAEIIGTALLILLGNGVVANAALGKTNGNKEGFIFVTFAWGLAVYVGVLVAGPISGAHLNPAVSVGLAIAGKFPWADVAPYITAQMIGAGIGSILVWMTYKEQYTQTEDLDAKLSTFSTAPQVSSPLWNVVTEAIGTFVLVYAVLHIAGPTFEADGMSAAIGLGSLGALPVALVVVVIGMSLGGPTGYAINPARDLGPRIMHTILPIGKKRDSDWGYSWIPIVGPILGAAQAAGLYLLFS